MSVRFASTRLVNVLGVCLVACSFAAQAAEKKLDRTFTVAPGGRLTIEADGSDLRVEGTRATRSSCTSCSPARSARWSA